MSKLNKIVTTVCIILGTVVSFFTGFLFGRDSRAA